MSRVIALIRTPADMETSYAGLAEQLLRAEPFDRGEVHAQKTTNPDMVTIELLNVSLAFDVTLGVDTWQEIIKPNLPWAEDHFQERVSGDPLNPPPAEAWWPYAQQGNSAHKTGEQFSHTYPERFWPRFANEGGTMKHSRRVAAVPHVGIRFEYGDLADLIEVLKKNPRSRQAYLPVWFPEDLNAANHGERVPCTLGYHFLLTPKGELDVTYFMRSCDAVRFLRDDVYMAGRLLHWVSGHCGLTPGTLRLHISNLHAFQGDRAFLTEASRYQRRQSYNFGSMF